LVFEEWFYILDGKERGVAVRSRLVEQFDQRLEQELRTEFRRYLRWIKSFANGMQRAVEKWAKGAFSFEIEENSLSGDIFDSIRYGVEIEDYQPGDFITYNGFVKKIIPAICEGLTSTSEDAIDDLIEAFYVGSISVRFYLEQLKSGVSVAEIIHQEYGVPDCAIKGDIFEFSFNYGFNLRHTMEFIVSRIR
jgi:hypothetical protein